MLRGGRSFKSKPYITCGTLDTSGSAARTNSLKTQVRVWCVCSRGELGVIYTRNQVVGEILTPATILLFEMLPRSVEQPLQSRLRKVRKGTSRGNFAYLIRSRDEQLGIPVQFVL